LPQNLDFAFARLASAPNLQANGHRELREAAYTVASDLCKRAEEFIAQGGLRPWTVIDGATYWCIVPHGDCVSLPVWSIACQRGEFYLCHSDHTQYRSELWADPHPLIAWISRFSTQEKWMESALSSLREYNR
jgi:hypothetical protein